VECGKTYTSNGEFRGYIYYRDSFRKFCGSDTFEDLPSKCRDAGYN